MRKIIVVLLLMLYSPSLVWADGFGSEDVGEYPNTIEDRIWAVKASPTNSGTLDSIKVYLNVTTQSHLIKLAVYLWSDTSFVDSTYIIDVPTGEGWVYFQFVNNASITAETEYALAAWGEATAGDAVIYYDIGGPYYIVELDAPYGIWPTPKWTTVDADGTVDISIYCYYTTEEEEVGQVIIIH